MRFNLAILSVLAARPEQRIPLEEVSREVKRMIAGGRCSHEAEAIVRARRRRRLPIRMGFDQ
ncbi:hypothetical protein ACVWW1_009923 [Bradyrhizobium sp. JR3.5]